MRVTLAVPDLLELPAAALTGPALAKLARYAPNAQPERGGLDAALRAAAGLGPKAPIAPLAALGAGFDVGDAYVLRADPIALIAGRDDVLLAGRVDDLTMDETRALIAPLNRHFAADGLVLHAPRPDAWFATTRGAPTLTTTPLGDVRGAIYPHLPRGDDARTWRRWWSEIQMLLHEHPVNAKREQAGRMPVTGVWFAGGGHLAQTPSMVDVALFAAAGAAGDLVRGLALRAGTPAPPTPPEFTLSRLGRDAIVVLPRIAGPGDFERVAHAWLEPLLVALERGELAAVTILADGGGAAFRWAAQRPSLLARVRSRFAPRTFRVPSVDATR